MSDESRDDHPAPSPPSRSMADVLTLSDERRSLVLWLHRHPGSSIDDLLAHTGLPESEVRALLTYLESQGYLRTTLQAGTEHFVTVLVARKRGGVALDL